MWNKILTGKIIEAAVACGIPRDKRRERTDYDAVSSIFKMIIDELEQGKLSSDRENFVTALAVLDKCIDDNIANGDIAQWVKELINKSVLYNA